MSPLVPVSQFARHQKAKSELSPPKASKAAAFAGKTSIASTNQQLVAAEKDFKDLLSNKARTAELKALWTVLDVNGNGIVSLAEIDKLMVGSCSAL